MIRRSPAEFYLKYLVVHPEKYDNERIIFICEQLGLDYLGNWYLNHLRAHYKPPTPFRPEVVGDVASQKFLSKQMIRLAFFPNEDMQTAITLLEKPRLREVVETMILSGAPHDAVVYALKARHQFDCNRSSVDLFRHYFWDVDLLDSTEMRALLQLRYESVLNSKEGQVRDQINALKKAYHTDPRVMAAKMPVSPLTALMAQIQLGVMPRDLNIVKILEAVRAMSALRGLEAAFTGGPQGAGMGQGFMVMADIASKMMETVVKPEDELRNDLMNIALKTSKATVPVLAELTGGNHTTELQPVPKSLDTEMQDEPEELLSDGDEDPTIG